MASRAVRAIDWVARHARSRPDDDRRGRPRHRPPLHLRRAGRAGRAAGDGAGRRSSASVPATASRSTARTTRTPSRSSSPAGARRRLRAAELAPRPARARVHRRRLHARRCSFHEAARGRRRPRQLRRGDAAIAGRIVWDGPSRRRAPTTRTCWRRADRQRVHDGRRRTTTPGLRPVHVGHDRPAQGRGADPRQHRLEHDQRRRPVPLPATGMVNLTVLPLFHIGGINAFANPAFQFGGRNLIMRSFDPAATLRRARRRRTSASPTSSPCPPTTCS